MSVCQGTASSGNASFRQRRYQGFTAILGGARLSICVCVCVADHHTLLGSAIRSITFAGVQDTLSEEQTTSDVTSCHYNGLQSQFY